MQNKYINEIKKILKIPPNISRYLLQEIYGRDPCNFSLGSTFLFCSENLKENNLFISAISSHLKKDGTISYLSTNLDPEYSGEQENVRSFISPTLNDLFSIAKEEIEMGTSFLIFDISKKDLQEITTNVNYRFSLQKLQSSCPNKTFFFFVKDISKKDEIPFFFLARSSAIILMPKAESEEDLSFIVIKNRIRNNIKGKRIFINRG